MHPESTPAPAPARTNFLYWTVALVLAAGLLFYSLRGIDWGQVWTTLKSTRLEYVGWMVLATTISLLLRAFRWCVLLRAGGEVHFSTAFWATCAGYFGNNYLPARAGELIRSVAVDGETGMGRTYVLTTALAERITDAISLVLISSLVLLTLPVRPGWYESAAKPFAIIGLCGALGIAVLPKLDRLWHSLLARAPVPERFRGALTHILDQILNGLRSFHDVRRLCTFLALTAVIWFMDAVGTILAAASLGMDLNLPVA